MNESIESGCRPLTITKDEKTMTFNIGKEVERIAREICKQQNKLVLNNLPTETLLKIKEQVEKELQERKNML